MYNCSYDRVEQFKYLGTTVTYQNSIQKEIKSRLKSGNAYYHSVQNLLSSSLLSTNTKINTYITIILPDVLYGCDIRLLTLREECMLRDFENRVLRRIFGLKRDEVTREWRKLHNEELNNQYSLPNIIPVTKLRRMRWVGARSMYGGEEKCMRCVGVETWGKSPLGRPRHRWKDNIKMDHQEVGWGGMDWINLAQDRVKWWEVVNVIINLHVP